jgi:hypothetical protein
LRATKNNADKRIKKGQKLHMLRRFCPLAFKFWGNAFMQFTPFFYLNLALKSASLLYRVRDDAQKR